MDTYKILIYNVESVIIRKELVKKLIIMTLIVDICRLTVTVREGGLEAQAKLYVVVKDVNDNEPTFEVQALLHI